MFKKENKKKKLFPGEKRVLFGVYFVFLYILYIFVFIPTNIFKKKI